jgi:CheY-like chemotaxis protein
MAFGRQQVLQRSEVELNRVVEDMVGILSGVIGKGIEIELDLEGSLRNIDADRGQIEQVLMNLCINGRDAMPQGGKLKIETKNVHLDESYCLQHPGVPTGDYVLLSIADSGEGMDEDTMTRIFDPFFTTKEKGRGTGLGLATVYGIIKQHGSLIDVSSKAGEGTCFSIHFPVADAAARPGDNQARASVGGNETILVAEAKELARNSMSSILRQAGYTVLMASEGEQTLKVFETNAGRISLALVDGSSRQIPAAEVCARIKALKRDARLLLSVDGSPTGTGTGDAESDIATIPKTCRPGDLLRSVRDLLDAA